MTTRAKPKFIVKEYGTGRPWIAIEYQTAEGTFPAAYFGFDLNPNATLDDAKVVARFLNEHITEFTYLDVNSESGDRNKSLPPAADEA